MYFGRLCTLASVALMCLSDPATSQQQSQQSPETPGLRVLYPDISFNQTSTDNHSAPANKEHPQDYVLWNTIGNGLSWYGLANQNLGMTLTPADAALRAHLKLPDDQGLIVTTLEFHSPAAQAGIEQNDILLKLENAALAKPADLEDNLKAAGDKPVSLKLLRGGRNLAIQVQPRVQVGLGPVQREAPTFWIGVSVTPIEPALRSQLKLPENEGLLAFEVIKDSPAAKAEIKVHDILTKLAGKSLDSQEKLVEIVQANGGKTIAFELIRQGKTETTEVTPQPRKNGQGNNSANNATYSFQFVRPGAMTPYAPIRLSDRPDLVIDQGNATATDLGIPKRLDELDAEIKQLRKAIEELSKALVNKH
jgi:membrane-associated protease RseP (regulator of RpoE activity)